MKKILLSIILISCFAFISNAQTVSGFENLTLSPNSYWDGSSQVLGAHFVSGNADFSNFYDTSYGGFWSTGFAYSNTTDSTTSGSGNQHSAKAASGYNSATYAVGQQNPFDSHNAIIKLTGNAAGKAVEGFYVTNTTYTYNSLRDGDAFAKKFGGVSGNDPDWFKLIVHAWLEGVKVSDSVEFYLADFRFSDNSQDYIVKDWRWVDLTSLGNVDSLIFTMNSSDASSFGINTPLFFCMDDFTTADFATTIKNVEPTDNSNIYPSPATNFVNVNVPELNGMKLQLTVSDVSGRVVLDENRNVADVVKINLDGYVPGVYFINLRSGNISINKKIVKE